MPNDPIEEEIKRLTREWSENWPTQWRVGVELRALVRRVREADCAALCPYCRDGVPLEEPVGWTVYHATDVQCCAGRLRKLLASGAVAEGTGES